MGAQGGEAACLLQSESRQLGEALCIVSCSAVVGNWWARWRSCRSPPCSPVRVLVYSEVLMLCAGPLLACWSTR